MNPPTPAEKKVLLELLKMFSDPGSTAKRYSRYAKICWIGIGACILAAALVGELTKLEDAKLILMLFAGVFIGLASYFGNASKQVAIITTYCSLDVAAVEERTSTPSV